LKAEKLLDEKEKLIRLLDAAGKNNTLTAVAAIQRSEENRIDKPVTSSGSAARLVAKRWKNGTPPPGRFLHGPPSRQAPVRDLAQQWTLYANLQFDFLDGDTGPADIRITFEKPGAWSYLGTDARHVPQNQPTMSLQAITQEPNEAAVSALILRQFGHVLAM